MIKLEKFYETNASYKKLLQTFDDTYFDEYLDFCRFYLKQGDKVLDVGCGSGISSKLLAREGFSVVGCDLSDTLPESTLTNLSFIQGDITKKLPFDDGSFDAVASYNAFEHVHDIEAAVKEISRVLNKNGRFLILCPNLLNPVHPMQGILRKGQTYFGKVNKFFLVFVSLKFAIKLLFKKVKPSIQYREPNLNMDDFYPDQDAVFLANPLDIRHLLMQNNYKIISYQKTSYKAQQRIYKKVYLRLMPSFSGMVRIVAQKPGS